LAEFLEWVAPELHVQVWVVFEEMRAVTDHGNERGCAEWEVGLLWEQVGRV
jgi:hypothetical protein